MTEPSTRDVERLGPQLYNGIAKQSTAFKLLAGMGWREGDGLGASKQGIKEHIKVKKKFNTSGMGSDEQGAQLRDWTAGMFTYDKVLSGLKEVSAAKRQPQSKDNSGGDDSSDDSEGDAVAARKRSNSKATTSSQQSSKEAKVVAAGTKQNSKKAAKQQQDKEQGKQKDKGAKGGKSKGAAKAAASSSSSDSSDSSDSDAAPAQPVSRSSARGTHVGRYQKRERAKMVGTYSANDLAAILGATPGAASATASGGSGGGTALHAVSAGRPGSPSSSEDEGVEAGSSSHSSSEDESRQHEVRSSQQGKKGSDTGGTATRQSATNDAKAKASVHASKPGQPAPWWASIFVRAGKMGRSKTERRDRAARAAAAAGDSEKAKWIRIHGFREEDQENLALQAKQHATQNKQGLGRSEVPKMAAGSRWCGSKTKIAGSDDEDEDEQDNAESSDDYEQEESLPNKLIILTSKNEQGQGLSYPKGCEPGSADKRTADEAEGGPKPRKEKKNKKKQKEEGQEGSTKRNKQKGVEAEGGMMNVVGQQGGPEAPSEGKKKGKKNGKKDKGQGVGVCNEGAAPLATSEGNLEKSAKKKAKKAGKKGSKCNDAEGQVVQGAGVEGAMPEVIDKRKSLKRKAAAEEEGGQQQQQQQQAKAGKKHGGKKKGSKRLKGDGNVL